MAEQKSIISADTYPEAIMELVRQLMPQLLDVPNMAEIVQRYVDEYGVETAELFAAGAYSLAALLISGRITIGNCEDS